MKRLTNGFEIGTYFDQIINDSVRSVKQVLHTQALAEKEEQQKLSPKSGDEEQADFDKIKDNKASKTMSDDSEALNGNVSLDNVVDKLNTIRSGKSFKDSLVTQRFNEYFNSLSDAEKVAMFAFLKGIAQIVTGEIEPEQATEPSDDPASIKMKKTTNGSDEKTKKTIKPNIIKSPTTPGDVKPRQRSGEDTTAPKAAPIQPKKRG